MHSVSPNRCLCFVLKPSDHCELNVRGKIKKNQQILEEIAIKPNISQLPIYCGYPNNLLSNLDTDSLDIKVFTIDTITPIYWIAFQIKKRGLLMSIHAFCSIGQSEQ
jgi:hypothetical protein